MNFKQYDDGSCDINFKKEEIEVINKYEKLHLSAESLRHFGNVLMRLVVEWNAKFPENIKNMQTNHTSVVEGKKPKDV